MIVRGDVASKAVQTSTVTLDDSDNLAGIWDLSLGWDITTTWLIGRDVDNIIWWDVDDSLNITIWATAHAIVSISDWTWDNDKLVTQGYVDDAVAGWATTALDNLASVAINTTLVSDTDNTDALGTTAIAWSDLFLWNESVITWNSAPSTADITLTHSANTLTLAGWNLELWAATVATSWTLDVWAITTDWPVTIWTWSSNWTVTSNGNYDLIIKTGNWTTWDITIVDWANGDIEIDPNWSWSVTVNTNKFTIAADTWNTLIAWTLNVDWAVDIDAATQMDWTLTVWVDDTGHDVKFFWATASAFMEWDESEDELALGWVGSIALWRLAADTCDIELNTAWLNDEKWSWTVITATLWSTVAVWEVMFLAADWKWDKNDWILDWTDTGFKSKLWICLVAGNDTDPTRVLLDWLIASAWYPAFTVWAPVYLDDTAWNLVVTQPSTDNFAIRIVWEAVSATVLHFNPSRDYAVYASLI